MRGSLIERLALMQVRLIEAGLQVGERRAHVLLDHRHRDTEALGDLAVRGVPKTVQDEDLPAGRVQLEIACRMIASSC